MLEKFFLVRGCLSSYCCFKWLLVFLAVLRSLALRSESCPSAKHCKTQTCGNSLSCTYWAISRLITPLLGRTSSSHTLLRWFISFRKFFADARRQRSPYSHRLSPGLSWGLPCRSQVTCVFWRSWEVFRSARRRAASFLTPEWRGR